MSKSLNSVKSLIKSVNNCVRHGKVEEVLEDIQVKAVLISRINLGFVLKYSGLVDDIYLNLKMI